jgi:glycosyltransferase involved in cell wall biosynthesis
MKIGVDATCFSERPSGARQRFIGIYNALIEQMPHDQFVIFEPADCSVTEWFAGARNVSMRHTPLPSGNRVRRHLLGLRYWRRAFAAEKFDVFECGRLPLVKASSGRTVLTIHDIRELRSGRFPGSWLLQRLLRQAIRSADHIVTVSETMKKEILSHFPQAQISVVYNGIDTAEFARGASPQRLRDKLRVAEPFILSVGHLERRKNYFALLDAIALLHAEGIRVTLLILGNDSGQGRLLEDRIAALGLGHSVQVLCGLSDEEVRCAYQLCSVFVFPSLYEGFGIPLLEAMAAGKSMVISDIPVFREITQDQAAYFDPASPRSIAAAIRRTLESADDRSRMIEYGRLRVRDFSYAEAAAQLRELYANGFAGPANFAREHGDK